MKTPVAIVIKLVSSADSWLAPPFQELASSPPVIDASRICNLRRTCPPLLLFSIPLLKVFLVLYRLQLWECRHHYIQPSDNFLLKNTNISNFSARFWLFLIITSESIVNNISIAEEMASELLYFEKIYCRYLHCLSVVMFELRICMCGCGSIFSSCAHTSPLFFVRYLSTQSQTSHRAKERTFEPSCGGALLCVTVWVQLSALLFKLCSLV